MVGWMVGSPGTSPRHARTPGDRLLLLFSYFHLVSTFFLTAPPCLLNPFSPISPHFPTAAVCNRRDTSTSTSTSPISPHFPPFPPIAPIAPIPPHFPQFPPFPSGALSGTFLPAVLVIFGPCGIVSCPCLGHEAESVPVNVRFCGRSAAFFFCAFALRIALPRNQGPGKGPMYQGWCRLETGWQRGQTDSCFGAFFSLTTHVLKPSTGRSDCYESDPKTVWCPRVWDGRVQTCTQSLNRRGSSGVLRCSPPHWMWEVYLRNGGGGAPGTRQGNGCM